MSDITKDKVRLETQRGACKVPVLCRTENHLVTLVEVTSSQRLNVDRPIQVLAGPRKVPVNVVYSVDECTVCKRVKDNIIRFPKDAV